MKKILFLICLGIFVSCCSGIKILDSKKFVNHPEDNDGYLFYPRQGEVYLSNIEDLIGNYVVIEAGPNKQASTKTIGRAITAPGIAAITKHDLSHDDSPYKSRITGGFSIDLSFAVASTDFKTEYVYDVFLKKNNSATIPQEFRYIDDNQFNNIYSRLPQKYYEVIFITGIEYRTLSIKEYIKDSAGANIGLTAIKVNGDVYYSNEQIKSVPIIYYTGIIESMRYGDYNSQDSIYYKKQSEPTKFNPNLKPTQVPNDLIFGKNKGIQNLKIIRKAKPRI